MATIGVKYLWNSVRKYEFVLLAITILISSLVSLTFAMVTVWASSMTASSPFSDIVWFCVKGIGLYAAVYVSSYFSEILINSILKQSSVFLEMDCMEHYLHTPSISEDGIVSMISQDVRMIRESFFIPTLAIPTYLCRALVPIIYLLTQNVLVGVCFIIGAGLMMIPQNILAHRIAALGGIFSKTREKSLAAVVDTAKGRSAINNNQAQPFFIDLVRRKLTDTERAEQKVGNTNALSYAIGGVIRGFADVVPFAVGIYLMHFDTRITIILLVAMLGTAGSIKNQLQSVVYLIGDLLETKEVRQRIGQVLAEPLAIPTDSTKHVTTRISDFSGLTVRDMSKRFDDKILYEDVSFTIPAGSKVLVTGESGAGKSTLFDLLMQNQQPTSGEIYLLGPDGQTRITKFHDSVALISQQPHIFNLSVRDNILMGKQMDDETLMTILEQVQLDGQLGEKPLDVVIEQNGANISGGQRIKLEIARALVDQKRILLADEITASLDNAAAKMIRDLLLTLPLTVIEVAHHYEDLSYYDEVLALKGHQILVETLK